MNILSVTVKDLEAAADTGIASQSVVMSIASDLLYLFRQAQQLAAIPDQPITDAHVQMVIDSHEKGYAMIVPCKIDYALAKEVQALRRAANPVTRDEDVAWWKQEAEDCKARLLELAKENEELRRRPEVTREEAIAKFREWNIGFPVERFKADYVIGWMLFHYPPKPAAPVVPSGWVLVPLVPTQEMCDAVLWSACPSLDSDGARFIYNVMTDVAPDAPGISPAPVVVPEHYQHLNELYHAQEKRLFQLAQRIKGPSFDKYAHSPSQAIDVLETAIFGQKPTSGKSELLQRAEKIAEEAGALAAQYRVHEPTEQDVADRVLRIDLTPIPTTPRIIIGCAAGRDGECNHALCPQLRDGEPKKSGRHCPLDHGEDDE